MFENGQTIQRFSTHPMQAGLNLVPWQPYPQNEIPQKHMLIYPDSPYYEFHEQHFWQNSNTGIYQHFHQYPPNFPISNPPTVSDTMGNLYPNPVLLINGIEKLLVPYTCAIFQQPLCYNSSSNNVFNPAARQLHLTKNGKRRGRPPGTFKKPKHVPRTFATLSDNNEVRVCRWDSCEKRFTNDEIFFDHIKTHLRENSHAYICFWKDCGREKSFEAFYQLTVHVRSHTNEKPFVCSIVGCETRCSRLENLKIHMRRHTGERPYVCRVCSKAFTNISDRTKHINCVHLKKKAYFCSVKHCTKSYTESSSFRKHMKRFHGCSKNDSNKRQQTNPQNRDMGAFDMDGEGSKGSQNKEATNFDLNTTSVEKRSREGAHEDEFQQIGTTIDYLLQGEEIDFDLYM